MIFPFVLVYMCKQIKISNTSVLDLLFAVWELADALMLACDFVDFLFLGRNTINALNKMSFNCDQR